MLYAAGTSANLEVIQNAAGRLLYYASSDSKLVSRRWTKAWMARHSDYLKTLKTKPISVKRLSTHIIEDVEAHFADFKRCKEK